MERTSRHDNTLAFQLAFVKAAFGVYSKLGVELRVRHLCSKTIIESFDRMEE